MVREVYVGGEPSPSNEFILRNVAITRVLSSTFSLVLLPCRFRRIETGKKNANKTGSVVVQRHALVGWVKVATLPLRKDLSRPKQ